MKILVRFSGCSLVGRCMSPGVRVEIIQPCQTYIFCIILYIWLHRCNFSDFYICFHTCNILACKPIINVSFSSGTRNTVQNKLFPHWVFFIFHTYSKYGKVTDINVGTSMYLCCVKHWEMSKTLDFRLLKYFNSVKSL